MQGYAKWMMQKKRDKKRDNKAVTPPKGFDISLADVISMWDINEKQIQMLGGYTARKEVAHRYVGQTVYYRRETIERLFGSAK